MTPGRHRKCKVTQPERGSTIPNQIVLVVDDQADVAFTVAELIRHEGHDVFEVTSGQDALTHLDRHPVDLVVTDLMMPEMDGWELIDHLHARQRPPRIIVMTGYVPQEAEAILLDTRSNGYLTKPIERIRLQVLLKATLRRGNLGRQSEAVVVEDDRTSLQMVAKTLTERGVYVVPFTSAEPAVKHIQENPPDLAIFDVNLPGISGLDACETLRQNPDTAWLPLLILTAHPLQEHVDRAIGLNLNGFVVKPHDPVQLIDKVFALIGRDG